MPWSPTRRLKMEPLFRDPRYLTLEPGPRLLLLTLLHYVDGAGREVASATVLSELLYEFDGKVTAGQVDKMLAVLEARAWLLLYEVGPRRYMQVTPAAWKAFVAIDGRDGSRYPAPDAAPVAAQGATWGDPGPTAAEGRGQEGEPGEPPWLSDPEYPTPAGCREHPNNTGQISCGACGSALRTQRRFMAGEISKEKALAEYLGARRGEISHEEALTLWRRRARSEGDS